MQERDSRKDDDKRLDTTRTRLDTRTLSTKDSHIVKLHNNGIKKIHPKVSHLDLS